MDDLNANQRKVADIVRFLCGRDATQDELTAAARPAFNFAHFRFQLLVGEECAARWPALIRTFASYAQIKKDSAGSAHKIAHDLSVIRRDLDRAQSGIDGAQDQMLALLRQVDSIARISATIQELETKLIDIGKSAGSLQDRFQSYLAQEYAGE